MWGCSGAGQKESGMLSATLHQVGAALCFASPLPLNPRRKSVVQQQSPPWRLYTLRKCAAHCGCGSGAGASMLAVSLPEAPC
jgi:hypothetical protein